MAFCGGKLRVVLATWHVPLSEVPSRLRPQLLHRTVKAADELARVFSPTAGASEATLEDDPALVYSRGYLPKIGVCGLNPHAGEGGLIGREEIEVINPTLQKLRVEFPGLSQCEPGDTLFARQLGGEFDVVVALYHDQGLAPLKVIDFDTAVNVTLGLPHVRTSPDHGTGFGIARKGIARATSFANAVTVARRLIAWRQSAEKM